MQKKTRKGKSSKKSATPAATKEAEGDATAAANPTINRNGREEAAAAGNAKHAIDDAIRETDAAAALGAAIRSRADVLRRDRLPSPERALDSGLLSLGLALGTAGTDIPMDAGGARGEARVDATLAYYRYGHRSPQRDVPSVVADYFLHTHGGTHAAQCLLSLLAAALGLACLTLPAVPSPAAIAATAPSADALARRLLRAAARHDLLQQTLLLAAAKHAVGLLGAASLGASARHGIPRLGVREARRHLEAVASDPVGRYLFYCALLSVWLGWFGGGAAGGGAREYAAGLRGSVVAVTHASAATAEDAPSAVPQLLDALARHPPPWFLARATGGAVVPVFLLAPVLLREVGAVLWVLADVLSLATAGDGMAHRLGAAVLGAGRAVLDAVLGPLLPADAWRRADSRARQRALAGLVARLSRAPELAVGGVLVADAAHAAWGCAVGGPAPGGAAGGRWVRCRRVAGTAACARLYLRFLAQGRHGRAAAIGSVRDGAARPPESDGGPREGTGSSDEGNGSDEEEEE